jgi:hypothetical protein
MELSTLLNALVQGAETGVLTQVASGSSAQPGTNAGTPGFSLPSPPGSSLAGQPGSIVPGQPGVTAAVPPGLNVTGPVSGQPGLNAPGQPGASVPGASGPNTYGQTAPALFAQQRAGTLAQAAADLSPTQADSRPQRVNLPVLGNLTDIYHGSEAPASPSLLAQSGVGAYIHLLNAFATHQTDDQSANLLTNNLGNASATLKSAYNQAVSTLPPELQSKDWSFSVTGGEVVFAAGKDALSAQEVADLRKAFATANVGVSAREVAAAITAMAARRQSGTDTESLAWSGIQADDSNFGAVVNLRTYVTTTVPGGNYHPNTPAATLPPQVPLWLGGMDLRELVSTRPNFFRADGSVIAETPDTQDEVAVTTEDATPLQGQCACGEIRFTVINTFDYAFYCHCSRCRLRTGSAFAAIAGIEVDKVQVIAGNDHLLLEGECSDGYGARCSRCHAFLFAVVRERKYMHVSLGTLDGTPSRLPDHHIYVASKAPWFQVTDGLPQYDELPPQGDPALPS